MNKNTIAFAGFVSALCFGTLDKALIISISSVCVLILSWLTAKIPFLGENNVNKLFIVTIWSTAVQMILPILGVSPAAAILPLAANMACVSVLTSGFREIVISSATVLTLSVVIGALPFTSSAAIGFIFAGIAMSVFQFRRSENA